MTVKIISIDINASIVEAVNLMFKYDLNGLPVIDKGGNLVGILTEYDLVVKGSSVYLPTFIKVFSAINLYKKDKSLISEDLQKILRTKVVDIMNNDPLTVQDDISLEELSKIFGEHHKVNPIPVLGGDKKMVGIVSRSDLLKFFKTPSLIGFNIDTNMVNQRELDKNVNLFLKDLESQFVLVSKLRTHLWLFVSILFALVGYIIAWALILRIN